ncbi:hypothetical protein TAMYLO_130156 [Tenacibaculum amylolyticum]
MQSVINIEFKNQYILKEDSSEIIFELFYAYCFYKNVSELRTYVYELGIVLFKNIVKIYPIVRICNP